MNSNEFRTAWFCGVVSAAAILARTALDWFVPPETFYARATVTTFTAIGLFAFAGFRATWRTGSLRSGMLAGIGMGAISAALVLAGSLVMFAFRHDAQTLWAIERSGGLAEVFTLPLIMALPGALIAGLGGILGKIAR